MKKKPVKFRKISTAKVRNHWKCAECKRQIAIVSPDWYEENGTPVCGKCGDDMKFSHVTIKK